MIQRVKQFCRAVTAKVDSADRRYVERYLPPEAAKLFYAMSTVDQRHALNVAHSLERLLDGTDTERDFMLRVALLHDVGRVRGDMGIIGKVAAVLLAEFAPRLANFFAAKTNFMHVYFHHAEIGAAKLKALGFVDEAAIIALHHTSSADESVELCLLKQADELN